MDLLRKGISTGTRVMFVSAEVTVAAKALEARHLAGPIAGKALAEGIAAIALLSQDLSDKDEAIAISARVAGPLGGMLVEATVAGDLRGYTNKKVLPDLDSAQEIATDQALGRSGNIGISRTIPGKILGQTQMVVDPPSPRLIAARYLNQSLQTPSAVEISVRSDSSGLVYARGIAAQKMPDSDLNAFIRVLQAFNDCRVLKQLEHGAALKDFIPLFDVGDIVEGEPRHLQFRCRCSAERAFSALTALSQNELKEIVATKAAQHITCHLCGNDYAFQPEEVAKLITAAS